MYRTSSAYKSEMKQDLRDRSFLYVYLGMVNQKAQGNVEITSVLADFAMPDVFENSKFERYYATAEENLATADTYFFPDDPNLYKVLNQGAVSKDLLGSITFTFGDVIERIGGLTIDFGDIYPTEFTATNGHDTYTFEVNTAGRYIAIGNFLNSTYITITPVSMVGGQDRLRIHSILFGIGFQFDNNDLISTKRVNQIDHLSRELPKRSFEFTINNLDQKWTMDNPDSYARALEEKQVVQVTYGRELPDGSIFKIPSMNMALNSWSSSHTTATFKAVGYMDYSTTTYYSGKVENKTLYELAETILQDMGQEEYAIDPLLRSVRTNNPLPIETHKSCLQMIANAGRCVLFEDSNGIITIKSAIIPDSVVTCENVESYSVLDNITNGETVYNQATAELEYATADTYFFGETPKEQTGLVSYLAPASKMTVTVEYEAIWSFVGLRLQFGIIYPPMITIDEYKDGVLSQTNDFEVDKTDFYLDHDFHEVDKIVITFSPSNGTRVHLNKLSIGRVTDYEIEEHDMMNLPTATQTERVRTVNVKYYEFSEGEKKANSTVNADIGQNLVTFSKPCYNYEVENGTVIDSGAYYVIFNSSVEGKVKVTANEYDKLDKTYTIQLRQTGQDLTLENDLIGDYETAKDVCEWFAEFYAGEIDYTITYRGEPALESGDRIYLENRFVDDNMILVTSEELSTSTGMGMNNTIKARQLSYKKK